MRLAILLILPLVVLGWWDVGHMLTAAIAEIRLNELDPFASIHFRQLVTSINKLCDSRSQTFIESACWPDDIKSGNFKMHLWDSWHFKDSPYIVDTVVPIINYTESTVSSIGVMHTATAVLKTNLLNNTAERALFARYAVHLLGDIHQPLHSVALYNKTFPKGDIGGNAFKVKTLNGTISNFHAFWDAGGYRLQNDSYGLPRPLNFQNTTVLKQRAKQMIDQFEPQIRELAKILDPEVWAQESFLIAQNTTYPFISHTSQLDENYTNLAYQTSLKRITLAGFRLANYAIDIYKSGFKFGEKGTYYKFSPQNVWSNCVKHSQTANSRIQQRHIRSNE